MASIGNINIGIDLIIDVVDYEMWPSETANLSLQNGSHDGERRRWGEDGWPVDYTEWKFVPS